MADALDLPPLRGDRERNQGSAPGSRDSSRTSTPTRSRSRASSQSPNRRQTIDSKQEDVEDERAPMDTSDDVAESRGGADGDDGDDGDGEGDDGDGDGDGSLQQTEEDGHEERDDRMGDGGGGDEGAEESHAATEGSQAEEPQSQLTTLDLQPGIACFSEFHHASRSGDNTRNSMAALFLFNSLDASQAQKRRVVPCHSIFATMKGADMLDPTGSGQENFTAQTLRVLQCISLGNFSTSLLEDDQSSGEVEGDEAQWRPSQLCMFLTLLIDMADHPDVYPTGELPTDLRMIGRNEGAVQALQEAAALHLSTFLDQSLTRTNQAISSELVNSCFDKLHATLKLRSMRGKLRVVLENLQLGDLDHLALLAHLFAIRLRVHEVNVVSISSGIAIERDELIGPEPSASSATSAAAAASGAAAAPGPAVLPDEPGLNILRVLHRSRSSSEGPSVSNVYVCAINASGDGFDAHVNHPQRTSFPALAIPVFRSPVNDYVFLTPFNRTRAQQRSLAIFTTLKGRESQTLPYPLVLPGAVVRFPHHQSRINQTGVVIACALVWSDGRSQFLPTLFVCKDATSTTLVREARKHSRGSPEQREIVTTLLQQLQLVAPMDVTVEGAAGTEFRNKSVTGLLADLVAGACIATAEMKMKKWTIVSNTAHTELDAWATLSFRRV